MAIYTLAPSPDGLTVVFSGEATLFTLPEEDKAALKAAYEALVSGRLAVDLAEVPFIDSYAYRVLISMKQRAEAQRLDFTLVNPSPMVKKLIDMTGLRFPIEERRPSPKE